MKLKKLGISLAIALSLVACGGSGENGSSGEKLTQGPDPVVQNVPKVTPSSQTSEEIVTLLKNAPALSYETIDPNIKLSIGYGGIKQGVDAAGKRVFMMGTHRQNFMEHNLFFCHESDMQCTRLVDNMGEQHLGSVGIFADGKIWINTLDRTVGSNGFGATLNYYDVNTREYKKRVRDLTGLNGETRTMSLGSDKRLYIGGTNFNSLPHYASVASVNPQDLNDYRLYTNYFTEAAIDRSRSIAADETHIYQVAGDNPYYLLAIDKVSGTGTKLHESSDGKVTQLGEGVSYAYTLDGQKVYHYLYGGAMQTGGSNIEALSCPWYVEGVTPVNHQGGYWPQKGNYYLEYNTSGYPLASYNVQNMPVTTRNESGVTPFEFKATTEGREISFTISQIDLYAQYVTNITALQDGNLLIRGVGYSGISLLNTQNDMARYIGALRFSPSVMEEFFDYSVGKTRVMFEGYPSTDAMIYDPSAYMTSENTESLGYLGWLKDENCVIDCTDNDIGTHRALEMTQIGQSLYFAAMQYRNGVSGAIISYDTMTKEKKAVQAGLFENYQTRSLLNMNGQLIVGTQAVDNTEFGGLTRPSTPKIFVMNPKTLEVIKTYTPLEGLSTYDSGRIESIDGRHIIGITNDQYANGTDQATKTFLYMIDTYTDEVIMKKTIDMKNNMLITPEGSSRNRNYDYVKHGEFIYTYLDARTLVKIDKTGHVTPLTLLPVQGRLSFANDYAYFTVGTEVLKMALP